MFLRYSYQPHNAHRRPLYAHPLQELQEAEAVEAEVEEAVVVVAEEAEEAVEAEEEADKQTPPTSDSAEIPLKYSREKEKKRIASFSNSNATT